MAKKRINQIDYHIFDSKQSKLISNLGKEKLLHILRDMIGVRAFEVRAESAYQQGQIGGFFHAYIGQEAIQTAAVHVMKRESNWWTTTYRCHALALLLGATPNEVMAELYGKVTGNALGRGGSMHLYTDRMLGGFGIVGGHLPIATGAGFTLKYQKQEGASICFLGDGAVAQGAVHESLNIASLWSLPCIYVIENNQWGMGTAVSRAIAAQPIAEHLAQGYKMAAYTLDGMDLFNCYAGFEHIYQEVQKKGKPVLVEVLTERFRGHSISDPGLYRSKGELDQAKHRDPIECYIDALKKEKLVSDEVVEKMKKKAKEEVISAMKFADESPEPDPVHLEEDVFAP